jgi:hypothetical protein
VGRCSDAEAEVTMAGSCVSPCSDAALVNLSLELANKMRITEENRAAIGVLGAVPPLPSSSLPLPNTRMRGATLGWRSTTSPSPL